MKTLITFCFILCTVYVAAQNPNSPSQHDNVWISGYEWSTPTSPREQTIINFNTFPPQVSAQLGNIGFAMTNTIMSDEEGELLFYCNGDIIQDKWSETLINGEDIAPEESVTQQLNEQSMVTIPYPDSIDNYFMLHNEITWVLTDTGETLDSSFTGTFTLFYSIISFEEEQGIVLEKNIPILNDTMDSGKITTCKHANGRDWWFIVPEYRSNNFYRYLLTPNGLDTLPPQTIGTSQLPFLGMANFTPDGTKYISTGSTGPPNAQYEQIDIFDFDRCTGLLSNQRRKSRQTYSFGKPVVISPNSRYLYLSLDGYHLQYDLWADDIYATEYAIEAQYFAPFLSQLGPDGKIYMVGYNDFETLHIIHDPDFPEDAANIQHSALSLPNKNYATIPHFPNYRLGPIDGSFCDTLGIDNLPVANFRHETFTDTVHFRDLSAGAPTDWYWTFGDGESSSEKHNNHIYSSGGLYEVCLTVSNQNGNNTWCDTLQILTPSAVEQQELSIESSVFPNPSDGLVLLQTEQNLPPDSHFKVYDQAGRLVFEKELQSGFNKQNIELYDLQNGIYFYEILLSNFVIGKSKLVIVK